MNEFNTQFEGLTVAEKQARYLRLAQACLLHYPAANGPVTFIAHNAGVVYRVESAQGDKFMLKIAQATGESSWDTSAECVNSVFLWLDAIARETPLTVQQPVANARGEFMTAVEFDDLSKPFYCSLQRWLDGEHPHDPSPEQAYQIGAMMAQLHTHGSQWIADKNPPAWTYDEGWLLENLAVFAGVRKLDIISDADWRTVETAVGRIQHRMLAPGTSPQVRGPIHSDIHHGNLLIVDGQMCPIDFGGMIRGHYLLDLGLTLYHFMYLSAETRQALVAGYQAHREIINLAEMDFEAFLCAAALANLAFNVDLPDQRTSRLFIRNVREFSGVYCRHLVDKVPFALEPYDYIR